MAIWRRLGSEGRGFFSYALFWASEAGAAPGMGSLSPLGLLWGLFLLQGVLRPLRGNPGVYERGMACMSQAEGIWLLKGRTWGS